MLNFQRFKIGRLNIYNLKKSSEILYDETYQVPHFAFETMDGLLCLGNRPSVHIHRSL